MAINLDSGEYDGKPEPRNWIKKECVGYSIKFMIARLILDKGCAYKFLILLLSSKILEDDYFQGITELNIKKVYDSLIKMEVANFTFEDFINGECTDVDFKKDFKTQVFRESISELLKNAKPSHLSGRGARAFKKQDNLGVQWSDRRGATPQNPYLKIYHKTIELNSKSEKFKNKYLFSKDISDIVRIEFTIKNARHFKKYNISRMKLINILNLSQTSKSAILNDIVNIHLMPRIIRPVKPKNQITPTDVIIYNSLSILSQRTPMNKDRLIDSLLYNIKSKVTRCRKKKLLNHIWDTYVQMEDSTKNKEKIISLFDAICW